MLSHLRSESCLELRWTKGGNFSCAMTMDEEEEEAGLRAAREDRAGNRVLRREGRKHQPFKHGLLVDG